MKTTDNSWSKPTACIRAAARYCRQYHYVWSSSWRIHFRRGREPQIFLSPTRRSEGRSYVVTSHGKPVARLVPASRRDDVARTARATLLARLERQPVMNVGRWSREELYEDDR